MNQDETGDSFLGRALMVNGVSGKLVPTDYMFIDASNLKNSVGKKGKFLKYKDDGTDGVEAYDLKLQLDSLLAKNLAQDALIVQLRNLIAGLAGGLTYFKGTADELKTANPNPDVKDAFMIMDKDSIKIYQPNIDKSTNPPTAS